MGYIKNKQVLTFLKDGGQISSCTDDVILSSLRGEVIERWSCCMEVWPETTSISIAKTRLSGQS